MTAATYHKHADNVVVFWNFQEWAVRVYRKKRPPADPTKTSEFTSAADDLRSAIKFFVHLRQLGKERSRIEDAKLDAHITFCKDQVNKVRHTTS